MGDGMDEPDETFTLNLGRATRPRLYRLRVFETTLRGTRFNNVVSQVTVLLQNTKTSAVAATVWFWGADGSALGNHPLTLPPSAR